MLVCTSRPWRRFHLTLALLTAAGARPLFAGGLRETGDYNDIVAAVKELVAKYGAENVLIATDLDNTLTSMDRDLGSDQWFEWQNYLLAAEPDSRQLVAKDFPGLLVAQGLLFDALPAHPTQPDLPALMSQVQGLGASTIILTARGHDFRGATEYEVARNGYDFTKHGLKLAKRPEGSRSLNRGEESETVIFKPYRADALAEAGITDEEFRRWKLPVDPQEVSYGRGILMVAGQHKGAMLSILLKMANHPYKAVVFVDQERQVRRTYDALNTRGYDVTAFDYSREDGRVKKFWYSNKDGIAREWRQFRKALVEGPKVDELPKPMAASP